jgi:hypothetical protein
MRFGCACLIRQSEDKRQMKKTRKEIQVYPLHIWYYQFNYSVLHATWHIWPNVCVYEIWFFFCEYAPHTRNRVKRVSSFLRLYLTSMWWLQQRRSRPATTMHGCSSCAYRVDRYSGARRCGTRLITALDSRVRASPSLPRLITARIDGRSARSRCMQAFFNGKRSISTGGNITACMLLLL